MSSSDRATDTFEAVSDFSTKSWWASRLLPSVRVTSSP